MFIRIFLNHIVICQILFSDDIVVIFVNEFWPVLYRVMLPIISDVWDPWMTSISNKIFSKVLFSEVFP